MEIKVKRCNMIQPQQMWSNPTCMMTSPALHNMITIIFASLLNGSAKVGNAREDHAPYQVLLP